MPQPVKKKARTQREPEFSRFFSHPTRSEDTTEAISGPVCASAERDMATAHPPPVQAVVLARPSRDASEGTVLLARDEYIKYAEYNIIDDITKATHLAKAAKARAQGAYPRWVFEGPAVVYDYNPTGADPQELEEGDDISLDLRRKALPNDTLLRGRCDPETQEVVGTFFVLVTAFEKQAEGKVEAPQPPVGRVKPSAFALCLFSKNFELAVAKVVEVVGNLARVHDNLQRMNESRFADFSITFESVPVFDMKSEEAEAELDHQSGALQPVPEDLRQGVGSAELVTQQRQVLRGKYPVISLQPQDGKPVYWMDNPAYGSRLIVRSCYERLWEMIMTAPEQLFVISGSPGIGKSWFLFFCMYKLAVAGIPFLYIVDKGRGTTYYLFAEGQRKKSHIPTPRVDSLLNDEAAYVLVDDRPPFSMEDTLCKVIVSTSPDRDKYKHFLNDTGDLLGWEYYMPVWSDEELAMKRQVPTKKRQARLTAQQLEELVRIAGRVPRYIFQHKSFERAVIWNKKTIAEAVQRKSVQKMLEAAGHLTAADKEAFHRILAIEVDERTFDRTGLGFHSPYTKQVVYDQLTNVSHVQLFNYYRNSLGSLKGNMFERYAHHRLANGARVLEKCLEADDPRSTSPPVEMDTPHANNHVPVFDRADSDLVDADMNEYLVPASEIFEAVDAICLPRFYQMTVSRTHPIKLNQFAIFLIRLSTRTKDPLQDEIPFIFIVPREELGGFGNQPFDFCGIKRTTVREMEDILRSKISEAERAAKSRAAEKATKRQASKQAKEKRARLDGTVDCEDDRAAKAFDKLQAKAALARSILDHRLLHRIRRYAWGISEVVEGQV